MIPTTVLFVVTLCTNVVPTTVLLGVTLRTSVVPTTVLLGVYQFGTKYSVTWCVPVLYQLQCYMVCSGVVPTTVLFGVYQCFNDQGVTWCGPNYSVCGVPVWYQLLSYLCGTNY